MVTKTAWPSPRGDHTHPHTHTHAHTHTHSHTHTHTHTHTRARSHLLGERVDELLHRPLIQPVHVVHQDDLSHV
jgi:hypothetical protein